MNELHAISPVDGRYWKASSVFAPYFSEFALIRYRTLVEVEYLAAMKALGLPQLKQMPASLISSLKKSITQFEEQDALRIKEIEKTTNHDVKAVEYYLREQFEKRGYSQYTEFIHFGLTSQDINNTAIPMMVQDALFEVTIPSLINNIITPLENLAIEWMHIPMLARTHGQAASPTTVGKELQVFVERLQEQFAIVLNTPISCKFGGATGNFNAHKVAYPKIDWIAFADRFCEEQLGLQRQQTTTQIEHYDTLAALFDGLKRICTILIDLCRDIWAYVSLDYFGQKIKKGEVGSSAMPHKVNPIDFENAEGNLGIAIALFEHLSAKLPISRLQRDLTDSTVCRNIGVPFSHMEIAFQSLKRGIPKLILNEQRIAADLNDNWAVVSEAIQTILRRESYPDPYGALKELTRTGKKITQEALHSFIDGLDISAALKKELKKISPQNYIGFANSH